MQCNVAPILSDSQREREIDKAYVDLLQGSYMEKQAAFTRLKIHVKGRSEQQVRKMEKGL